MRRRALLALVGSALSVSVAGCSERSDDASPTASTPTRDTAIPRSRPDVDCDAAARPMPPEPDAEAAVQPVDYPGEPPESLDDESAIAYLERFENAYRRNHEIEKTTLVHHSNGVTETWTYDAPPGAAIVRFRTVYSGTLESGAHYDSPNVFVSYYLDPTLVVRAERAGGLSVDTDALDPDPYESGQPVACFE